MHYFIKIYMGQHTRHCRLFDCVETPLTCGQVRRSHIALVFKLTNPPATATDCALPAHTVFQCGLYLSIGQYHRPIDPTLCIRRNDLRACVSMESKGTRQISPFNKTKGAVHDNRETAVPAGIRPACPFSKPILQDSSVLAADSARLSCPLRRAFCQSICIRLF